MRFLPYPRYYRATNQTRPTGWDKIEIGYGSGYYDRAWFDRCPGCIKEKKGTKDSKD